MMLRKWVLVLIVVVGLAAIGILLVGNVRLSRQELKSCFSDVQGLRTGAEIRISGVDVGTVHSVRANPQNKDCPAEVEMSLATPYDLHVPRDAIAGIGTTGLLGQSYLDIDVSQASGPPLENYGYLKSKPTRPPPAIENLLDSLGMAAAIAEASKAAEKTSVGKMSSSSPRRKP